jgi:UDP-N-acetylmuramate dehydrogenase
VQNVGAYGQEVSGTITAVRVLDLQHLKYSELPATACGFAYRKSIFNSTHRDRFVVTRVDFRLRPKAFGAVSYPDVQRAFAGHAGNPTPGEVAAAVRTIRHGKGMLLVDGEADCRSAGSFFKNPVVSEEQAARVAEAAGKEPPRFAAGQGAESAGLVKLPAAWLIEQAGFAKGFRLGRAGVSSRHTLALVNLRDADGSGGATAADVLALAEKICGTVEARFGIRLEMEPVLVGF